MSEKPEKLFLDGIPLTPEEFLIAVKTIIKEQGDNPEAWHASYDDLCEMQLKCLGYHEGINAIDGYERWYS